MEILKTSFTIDLNGNGDTLIIQYTINANNKLKDQLWSSNGELDVEATEEIDVDGNKYQYNFYSAFSTNSTKQLYFYDTALDMPAFNYKPISIIRPAMSYKKT